MNIDAILEKHGKPRMLPKPLMSYDTEDSRIPERIRISFTDGTTAVYTLHTDMPGELMYENIRIIREWNRQDGRRRRRRRHAE